MNLPDLISQGAEAKALLETPAFVRAFESVRTAIHEQWESSPIRDNDGQHELRLMLKLLNDLKGVIELAVHDGKAARMEIDRLNNRVLSPKQWMGR
jgi:hypothetical protein